MKDSLILYTAYGEKFKKLTDEQFGQLTRLMIQYQMTGEIPKITDPLIELSFDAVKYDIDTNNDKYEKVVQRNRENGAKGGRPKNPEEPKKPTGFLKTPKNPDEPKKADNDNDNDNDNEYINKREGKAVRFIPPSVEEVRSYCRENNFDIDAQEFVDFYESKGWMVGKNKMKEWKAAIRTWVRRRQTEGKVVQMPMNDENTAKRKQKYEELEKYYLGEE